MIFLILMGCGTLQISYSIVVVVKPDLELGTNRIEKEGEIVKKV